MDKRRLTSRRFLPQWHKGSLTVGWKSRRLDHFTHLRLRSCSKAMVSCEYSQICALLSTHISAKHDFGLSDKDIASLQFQGYANSSKRVYAVEQLIALAKRKYEKTGIDYPNRRIPENMLKLRGMTKTSEKLTGLSGREENRFLRLF